MNLVLVEKDRLVIGEPYYFYEDEPEKMVFVGTHKKNVLFFYPIDKNHSFIEDSDGTIGFYDPFVYEEV